MKHQTFLKAYKTCLSLYPKVFRHRYAEQMYLTAEDLLADARTPAEVIHVAGWLVGDTGIGLVREHSKRLGGNNMGKQAKNTISKRRTALLVLRALWVSIMVVLLLMPIPSVISLPLGQRYVDVLVDFVPLVTLGLSFWIVAQVPNIGWWKLVVRSILLATAGVVGYIVFIYMVDQLWSFYHTYTRFAVLQYAYDSSVAGLYLLGFYVVSTKLLRRFEFAPKPFYTCR